MKRIAAPMVGGMVTAIVLSLLVIPVLYRLWKEIDLRRAGPDGGQGPESPHTEGEGPLPSHSHFLKGGQS